MIDRNGSSSASPPASAPVKPLKDIENKTPRYDCLDPNCKSVSYYDPMVISPILYSFPTELYELKALLDEDVFIWIGETMSPTKISQLVALFNNGNFNTKISIIERIKNARKNGINANDIVFDIPEQIFDNITNPKIKCIHDKLRYGENSYINNIIKFEGEKANYDIVIRSVPKLTSPNTNGDSNGQTYFDRNRTIYITINEDYAQKASALDIAKTIFHEYIHADIYRKLGNKDVDSKDFDQVLKQYGLDQGKQHEIMAKLYIETMRDALREFHKKEMPREYAYFKENYFNNTIEYPEDLFYEALAWKGLRVHNVKAYQELVSKNKDKIDKMKIMEQILAGLTLTSPCQ